MTSQNPNDPDFVASNEDLAAETPDNEVEIVDAPEEIDPLEQLTAERDQLKDQLLRTHAEMENVRKRLLRERDEERRYAQLPLLSDLLPVMDNLQRAIQVASSSTEDQALRQGVEMVYKQFEDVLGRHGAQSIAAVGEQFDPHVHEALQQVPTAEQPPMSIIQELERGFKLHDRVIRPSKVIVAAAPSS